MRIASHFASEPRRKPQQQRGEKRVCALLNAAASVIAEDGYEAATMSAIAGRAGASIGSLYQFFPNKLSVAQALRIGYVKQLREFWTPLANEAGSLDLQGLVNRLIDSIIEFMVEHPAFPALLDAPASTRSPTAIRRIIREQVAGFLMAKKPGMPRGEALCLAAVTLQIIKTFSQLYIQVQPRERRLFIQEFKMVLFSYLSSRIEPGASAYQRVAAR